MFRINRIHDSDDSLSDLENGNTTHHNHLGTNGIHLNATNGIHRLSDTDHCGHDLDTDCPDHCNNSSMNEYVCSSPSNSRLSSFQEDDDDDDDDGEDENDEEEDEEEDDDSSLLSDDYGLDIDSDTEAVATPVRTKSVPIQERDSGTASASNSMLKGNNVGAEHVMTNLGSKTIDAEELLRKLNKVKKNYRVKFEDSDSD